MKISIITICKDNLEGLVSTYKSIEAQTNKDYEWIVIDGNSVDGTLKFLGVLDNDNIQWVSEPDEGIYHAMNKGIDRARGKYLYFLNAGDELAKASVLSKLLNQATQSNWPDLLYGDSYERTETGKLHFKKARSHNTLWYGMFAHHQSMLYNNLSIGTLRFNMKFPIGADYAFTVEFIKKSKHFMRVPFGICIFEQGGLSSKQAKQGRIDQWRIKREILKLPLLICVIIRIFHIIMQNLKFKLPRLYNWIRFS